MTWPKSFSSVQAGGPSWKNMGVSRRFETKHARSKRAFANSDLCTISQ